VIDFPQRQQRAVMRKKIVHNRIRFPHRFTEQDIRNFSRGAFGLKEPARGVDRAIDREAILTGGLVVFLAVAGSGVDGAGAGFERDVLAQDSK
jgi:hypothetical protein